LATQKVIACAQEWVATHLLLRNTALDQGWPDFFLTKYQNKISMVVRIFLIVIFKKQNLFTFFSFFAIYEALIERKHYQLFFLILAQI
jgi:hypothetical protein